MHNQTGSSIAHAYCSDNYTALSHHFHNAYELIFIEEGRSQFIINGQRREYGKNHLIFINQLEQHQMRPQTRPYIRHVVMMDPDSFDRFVGDPVLCSIFKQRPAGFEHGILLHGQDAALAHSKIGECSSDCQAGESYAGMAVLSNILSLLIQLYRRNRELFPFAAGSHAKSSAAHIQEYIDRHYLEELSLDRLSSEFHLNKFHLLELFKQVTGYTVRQYIVLKRISHAKNLLYYSDRHVSEIALISGFNSSSHFIRSFQKHQGVTPLQYRKHIQ